MEAWKTCSFWGKNYLFFDVCRYRDSSEWKPFHHDAAAVKADKAQTQNFTVAVSFGMERDAAFEHAKTKYGLSLNGKCIYFENAVLFL